MTQTSAGLQGLIERTRDRRRLVAPRSPADDLQPTQRERTIPISVIIMTLNEERVLPHTLASVRDFAQVFVVDSQSSDRTRTIAKDAGVEVVDFDWDGGYPKKKEWSLLNLPLKHDWVLYLDADELVTPALANELGELLQNEPQHVAYDVDLDYHFLGRQLKHGHRVTKRILARHDSHHWPHIEDLDVSNMWEVEGHYQPVIHGTIGRLNSHVAHNDRDPLYDYFARHNRYSDWEAHLANRPDLAECVRGTRSKRGQRYANLPFKPLLFFLYSYLIKQGFRDGSAGFHYAAAHAFYFWQIAVKRQELERLSP